MDTCTTPDPIALGIAADPTTPQSRRGFSPQRLIYKILRPLINRLEDLFPIWGHGRHQEKWNRRWARPEFRPFWRTEEPQKELVEAIETGWFPKDRCIYDIGCGAGETSRWLSSQRLRPIGLDFSPVAIDLCRHLSAEGNGNVRFEVVDMCAEEIPLEPASAIIERGCFQQIMEHFRPAYVRNIARLTKAGGHFLLIAATYEFDGYEANRYACSEAQLRETVEKHFRPYFAIERAEAATINATEAGEKMPAVAFWMLRRETTNANARNS